MSTGAWFRSLLSMRRSKSAAAERFTTDSLVPQLTIKRLEDRLVLNADVAPAEVLVVNAGEAAADGQADVYHVEQVENEIRVSVNGQQVQAIAADRVSAIEITGSADNDVLVADLLAGVNLTFDGGGGQDSVSLTGADYDRVSYEIGKGATNIAAHSPTATSQIELIGVEQITDSLHAANREFSIDTPGSQVTLADSSPGSYTSQLVVSSPGGVTVDFLNPSNSLTIDTSGNDSAADAVEVERLGAGFDADLRIVGGADDTFEIGGDLDLGRGNLTISTGSVVLNHSITSAEANFNLQAEKSVLIDGEGSLFNAGGSVRVTAPEISIRGMMVAAGGFVSLDSGASGVTKIEGLIDVAHLADGGQGGELRILGNQVQLLGTARIDASGHSGGGTVLVGGGYQGSDPSIRNGQYTYLGTGVVVNADAVFAGFGGTAIFWADKATAFYGTATARGGAYGGDGGLIEISGKEGLAFNGWADAAAPAGRAGTVLFDPDNVIIHDQSDGPQPNDGDLDDILTILGDFEIDETILETLAATSNIVLTATNNITLNDLTTDGELNLAIDGSGSLTIIADSDNAGGGTFIMQNVANTIQTAGGSITISGNVLDLGTIISGGGDISITGDSLTLRELDSGGGDITLIADGAVSLTEAVDAVAGTIRIVADGDVTQAATGLITAGSLGVRQIGNNGNITLNQANDVDQFAAFNADNGGSVEFTDANTFAVASVGALGDFDATTGISTTNGEVALVAGVEIEIGANITTTGGDITFGDPVTVIASVELSAGTGTIEVNTTLDAGANNLTLSANEIDFGGGANSVSGTGTLILQPGEVDRDINIGFALPGLNALDLTTSDLAALADGFADITIGRSTGTHDIDVNTVSFRDTVTIRTSGTGNIDIQGQLDTLAGGGSITLLGNTNLDANIVTAGFTIDIQGNVTVPSDVLLDSTDANAVAAGALVNVTGSLNGDGGILVETLTINAGTGGAITLDDIGNSVAQGTNLTIVNSNSTTISGVASVGILTIQDTTNTVAIQGNATITTLTTAVQPYGISLTGSSNTITDDVDFDNTGAVTLGNAGADIIRFLGGIDTTGGPTLLNLHGQLRTNGQQTDLGPVVLQGTSVIDTTNNGASGGGANVNAGAITGDNRALTIIAGNSGNVFLTTVGAAGDSLAALAIEASSVTLSANVVADSQEYDADVSTTSLLDTTDGGGNPAGGSIDISGALTGLAPQLNGGANGVISVGSVNVTTLTIVNSGSTTINNAAMVGTLDIQDTTGTVAIQGNATITTLTTTAQGYGVSLTGSSNSITNDTDFLNSGIVTLGDSATDVIRFLGGVSTTTGPSPLNLFGQLRTNGSQIDLAGVALQGDSVIDATNNGAVAAGASINVVSVTGAGNDLELNAGTTGTILVAGASTNLGAFSITQTLAATFLGNLSAGSLITTAQPYTLALLGTTNSVTNDVEFLNTGTLILGNSTTDTFLFAGGVDTTGGPSTFNLFGQLRTSGDQIDLADVALLGNSEIDATNNGGTLAGGNINVGTITGDNFTLEINAGNNGDVNLAAVGAAGTSLASFDLTANTATLNANIVADAQDYTADLVLAEGSNILLDTTDGGLLIIAGPINVTGAVNGTAGGALETLRLDAGILGAITLDDLGNSAPLNATILNSLSTTIAGSATLGLFTIVDTTLDISVLGDAEIVTLVTVAQLYNVALLGSNNEITSDTNFLNIGTVTLGNGVSDVILFNGGVSTMTGPSQTNLFGQLRTSGDQIDLVTLVLQGDSRIDSTNGGGAALGANINTGTINGLSNDLSFDAGTAGDIVVGQVGAVANPIGDLEIESARNVTALGTINAARLTQAAGTAATNLQGAASITNDVSITTIGNVLVNGVDSADGSVSLTGEFLVIGANISAVAANQEIVLDALSNAANAIQLGPATTLTTSAGQISGQALLATVLDMSVNVGMPLAPPDMIIGMIEVFVNDTLGLNFTIEVDWRFSERPGIPAPMATPVFPPPQNLGPDVISSVVQGADPAQFEHQYDDSPEPNPGDDINVSIAITQFADDTIRLSRAGTSVLADGAVMVNVVVPVDVPLFGFVLVPPPSVLPVTPPPAPLANPFVPPVVQITQISNNPFEPSTAGVTGRAEVRYYELRIVSFDEDGKLVESPEERINLSDPRLEAITPFNPSKLPELFKRLPGDRYRIYLIEDGAERLMIEFVIERIGDEGRPIELPERIESEGQGARIEKDSAPAIELQDHQARVPGFADELPADNSFVEELGRTSFVSSGGLVFGAAMLSAQARQKCATRADERMAGFRKRLRNRSGRTCHWNSSRNLN